MRTHTKETLEYKTWHNPATSSTLCRTSPINSRQNKNTNPVISRQEYHLTQPRPSEEKQTNKQKLITNLTLYEAHANHWTNLRRAETKRKKEFNLQGKNSIFLEAREKETSNKITLKKKKKDREIVHK